MNSYTADTTAEEVAADCQAQISNKTILVTGASRGGLGATFATVIAKHGPACIILATRDLGKAEETAREISSASPSVRPICIELQLDSLSQIREAAEKINALDEQIDVLVNNAGVMAGPFGKTVDGIERQFAVNHVGHFLLTNLLLPKILARGLPIRVVNVSSQGYRLSHVRFEDWNFDDGKTYNQWRSYGQAKSANNLFAVSLAHKLGSKGLNAVSLHPGVIFGTNLNRHVPNESWGEVVQLDKDLGHRAFWNGVPTKTQSQGTATHVFAAFHPSLISPELNGSYISDSKVVELSEVYCWGRDAIEAEKLWKLSEKLVSQDFAY